MPASLAETLYHAWRRAQHDITAHPAWGNLESEQQLAWERVAEVARQEVNAESLRHQAKAREPKYCPRLRRRHEPAEPARARQLASVHLLGARRVRVRA